jgi:hypothetical protein
MVRDECYAPYGISANVGAEGISVNLGNGVGRRGHRESTQDRPQHRDRREIAPNLVAARSRYRIADHNRVPTAESSVEVEIEADAIR